MNSKKFVVYANKWSLAFCFVALSVMIISFYYEIAHISQARALNYQYFENNLHLWHCRLNYAIFPYITSWPATIILICLISPILIFFVDTIFNSLYIFITNKPILTLDNRLLTINVPGTYARLYIDEIQEIKLQKSRLELNNRYAKHIFKYLYIKPYDLKKYAKQYNFFFRWYVYLINKLFGAPIILSSALTTVPIESIYKKITESLSK